MRLSVAGEVVEVGYTGGVGVDDMMWGEMFGVVVVGLLFFGVGVTMRERRPLGLWLFVFVVRLNVVHGAPL